MVIFFFFGKKGKRIQKLTSIEYLIANSPRDPVSSLTCSSISFFAFFKSQLIHNKTRVTQPMLMLTVT